MSSACPLRKRSASRASVERVAVGGVGQHFHERKAKQRKTCLGSIRFDSIKQKEHRSDINSRATPGRPALNWRLILLVVAFQALGTARMGQAQAPSDNDGTKKARTQSIVCVLSSLILFRYCFPLTNDCVRALSASTLSFPTSIRWHRPLPRSAFLQERVPGGLLQLDQAGVEMAAVVEDRLEARLCSKVVHASEKTGTRHSPKKHL